jgi:hypothetical protein
VSRILKRPVIVGAAIGAAALAALLVGLSLSGGSNSTAGATTTSTTTPAGTKRGGSRSTVSAARAWHNLAQCYRSHGLAVADPTVNADGTSSWSTSSGVPQEVKNAARTIGKDACRAEYGALPSQALHPPPTPAELHGLVLLARCMREHGIPDWPDPDSRGAFRLNARLQAFGKNGSPEGMRALRACSHYNLGDGLVIVASGPDTAE